MGTDQRKALYMIEIAIILKRHQPLSETEIQKECAEIREIDNKIFPLPIGVHSEMGISCFPDKSTNELIISIKHPDDKFKVLNAFKEIKNSLITYKTGAYDIEILSDIDLHEFMDDKMQRDYDSRSRYYYILSN